MTNELYLDSGNWDIKIMTGSKKREYFRHALAPVRMSKYMDLCNGQLVPPEGYALVNGKAYAYGDAARRLQVVRRYGAQRYQADYYGVLAALAAATVYKQSADDMLLFATHAPRDMKYARDIRGAVQGVWDVTTHKGEFQFRFTTVRTMNEPVGGLQNYMLTDRGTERRVELKNQTVLVVDMGGLTTDIAPVDPQGLIDRTAMNSIEAGAINIYEAFEEGVRSRYHDKFRSTTRIQQSRLESQMLKGAWTWGETELDVQREADEAINLVVNIIADTIENYGGMVEYDAFLLTGGGAVLMENALKKQFPRARIVLAEKDRDMMRYANINGVYRFAQLAKKKGVLYG